METSKRAAKAFETLVFIPSSLPFEALTHPTRECLRFRRWPRSFAGRGSCCNPADTRCGGADATGSPPPVFGGRTKICTRTETIKKTERTSSIDVHKAQQVPVPASATGSIYVKFRCGDGYAPAPCARAVAMVKASPRAPWHSKHMIFLPDRQPRLIAAPPIAPLSSGAFPEQRGSNGRVWMFVISARA